jgi:hypothetical protein
MVLAPKRLETSMPSPALPEITLGAAVVPTVLPVPESIKMPSPAFAIAAVPAAFVPMKLPAMTLSSPVNKLIPTPLLPEITFPAPAPPIVFPPAPTSTPTEFGIAAVPVALRPMRLRANVWLETPPSLVSSTPVPLPEMTLPELGTPSWPI